MKRIVCLSVAIIFFSFLVVYEAQYLINKKNEPSTPPVTEVKSVVPDYSALGIKAIDCFPQEESLPEQIWLLSKIYSQSKNSKYFDLLTNKISQLSTANLSSSPLKCKMFSEIIDLEILSEEQSEILKKICLNYKEENGTSLIQKLKSKYDENRLSELFHTKNDIEKKIIEEVNESSNVTRLALLSSENIGKYSLLKESESLLNSRIFFQQAYESFIGKFNWEYVEGCTLASASLDHYQLSGNKIYLEISNDILDKIKNVNTIKHINLSTKSSCTHFLTKYISLTTNSDADKLRDFLLENSLEFNFDDKDYPSYRSGSKCFIDYDNNKPLFENSLIISSLLETK
jgi:hypothetical protein